MQNRKFYCSRVVGKKVFHNIFEEIISINNLFLAWKEFKKGKSSKLGILKFDFNLEDNIFKIHESLKSKTWNHAGYSYFLVKDPKLRKINKSSIADRLVNQAVYRILYQIFDKSFIFDSYSSRKEKGLHKAVFRLEKFSRKSSKNYEQNIFYLKCDIKRFFENISHKTLFGLIKKKIKDDDALYLIGRIISSFNPGIPLGNATSQVFANIYLNELDFFIKHILKAKYYIRYCDDFVILENNKNQLIYYLSKVNDFLEKKLGLKIHQDKVIIKKLIQGIDFLGYIQLPHYRILRNKTKKRIFQKISNKNIYSYLGLLKHCKGFKIKKDILKLLLKC